MKPAKDALLIVYGSPVGRGLFQNAESERPIMVAIAISDEQGRECSGGTGDVKVGGNYAAS